MSFDPLSRRERQIMDIVHRQGRASVQEVVEALPNAPNYSTIRTLLHILEQKGHLRHEAEGKKYVYLPVQPRQNAARAALLRVVSTFFGGSVEKTVATLLSPEDEPLSEDEMERLTELIEKAREGEQP